MNYRTFLLDYFDERLTHTEWLVEKDTVYADYYKDLRARVVNIDVSDEESIFMLIDKIDELVDIYGERARNSSDWVVPKKRAANELVHDENGNLTKESIDALQRAIVDDSVEKTFVSDTGKTISFGSKWYKMVNSCSFKATVVEKLTDFISKLVEENGWSKYFDGNIGKNNQQQVQDYHPMDKYNKDNPTKYVAMHLGGNNRRCVLASVETGTRDGRGEPSKITFLEVGAHTIIDPYAVESFTVKRGKPITEATVDDLAELLDIQ